MRQPVLIIHNQTRLLGIRKRQEAYCRHADHGRDALVKPRLKVQILEIPRHIFRHVAQPIG